VITRLDRLFLERAYELAARGAGSTSPNPPVGAVLVRDERVIGEGYHHRAGTAHAEAHALAEAGDARGATLYVSLEPCALAGRTPACAQSVLDARVARVVIGTRDPTRNGGGAEALRARGVDVAISDDPEARELVAAFVRSARDDRPFVALKMAMSLDGAVAPRPGVRERLGSAEEERYVRDLRATYDAVMVGAGTLRIDDPQLTVRPPRDRVRPYARVIACAREPIDPKHRVFARHPGYVKTIALVPAAQRERFEALRAVADVIEVDVRKGMDLDLDAAMAALRRRGIFSLLCEGGPRLGASMLASGVVDRIYWAIAPRLLGGPDTVPVLAGAKIDGIQIRFDRVEQLGPDVMLSGTVARV